MGSAITGGLLVDGIPVTGAYIPPITGRYFHVCPGSATISGYGGKQIVGSSSNDGSDLAHAMDSIVTAYNACTSGAGDGIILWSFGTTTAMTSSYLSASLAWSKHDITVVGVCAPTSIAQRSRVTNLSTATALANIMTVSGDNNTFLNFALANYGTAAGALGGLDVTGSRNYFGKMHIVGAGSATPAALTGSYSLQLNSADENLFEFCTIGSDTVDQDGSQAATGVIKFANGCETNVFKSCRLLSYYSYASATSGAIHHVGAGDSITRTQEFRDCSFINYKTGLPTTTPPLSLVVGTAPNNGVILLTGQTAVLGFAAYDANAANDRVYVASPAANLLGGFAVTTS